MKPTWILQTNFASEVHLWISAFEALGSKYKTIEIVPFSDDVPFIDVKGPTIVYGTTTLIKNSHSKGYGVFFDHEKFRPSLWQRAYKDKFFNSEGKVVLIHMLPAYCQDGDIFIRPNSDLKDFSGSVANKEGILKFVDDISKGGYPFDENTEVFISPIKSIYKEYRVFMVNGKAVAASQYRLRSMLAKRAQVPIAVTSFAEDMAKIWSPDVAFVMDVCEDDNGQFFVLELNCFNASGVYLCDVPSIVKAVEDMYESN